MTEALDFSDIYSKHSVNAVDSLESIVVIDGMPIIGEDKQSKLFKALIKSISTKSGIDVRDDQFYMPLVNGKSDGLVGLVLSFISF